DTELDARQVHYGALATVADMYGVVVPTQESLT
ncbi:cysteine hydrolase, partial [Streptomyces sp. SID6648]|nr:cysteine hydrolase [Streptomyces sp. SID6648]